MSGRIILIILGKGQRFPGIGPLPTFWPFTVSLRTVIVLVGVSVSMLMYYNEHIQWGSESTGSRIFHHLGPGLFSLVFITYYGYVILLKVVPCPLPSCFNGMGRIGVEVGKRWYERGEGRRYRLRQRKARPEDRESKDLYKLTLSSLVLESRA